MYLRQNLLFADSTQPQKFGTELEKLIPDPAIYKFETGTGFEVRPVVQPDGQSVTFDFNYMYTTDLLEPTSPDERNLGRVKRHFVDTEVQLGNLEWREISRYEVALKAARNSRGVPLLEDIPGVGLLFRPLPQSKKSIQKNIIIGQAAIYPTVEDLLGLKSPSAAGLDVNSMPDGLTAIRKETRDRSKKVKEILERESKLLLPVYCSLGPGCHCEKCSAAAKGAVKRSRTEAGADAGGSVTPVLRKPEMTDHSSVEEGARFRRVRVPGVSLAPARSASQIERVSYERLSAPAGMTGVKPVGAAPRNVSSPRRSFR